MKKLIFTHDFLFHSFANEPTYHKWLVSLLKPVISSAIECEFEEFKNLKNLNNPIESFSRERFFELSSIQNPSFSYFNYDFEKITDESIDYLKEFINENSFIFGVELSENLRKIFDKIGLKFINITFHSFKLFDDLPLLFNTNDKEIFDVLNNYKIPKEKFEFYANYWRVYFDENNFVDKSIAPNSVLFVGQTLKDMSVEDNGKFLSVLDYEDYLQNLCRQYRRVYYLPHPRLEKKKIFQKYLNKFKNVEILNSTNVYTLLSNPNIDKVVGISSSVLYEAKFFGKDVEYLLHPLYEIDEEFAFNTYISIYNDFYKPSFWKGALKNFFETKKVFCDENFFKHSKNKLRDIKDLYWAYGDLDCGKNLKKYIKSNIKRKNLLLHFEQTEKHIALQIFGFHLKIRKNRELTSGERQTSPFLCGIRKDHIGRYLLAKNYIKNDDNILDCACGIGYGSFLLSRNKMVNVTGVDISQEAIAFAKKNYSAENIKYICDDVKNLQNINEVFNKIICFETIEHVKDDTALLTSFYSLMEENGLLILSTPNEKLMPFNKKQFPFHKRHYKPDELIMLLDKCGFEIVIVYSQKNNQEENLIPGWDGIFNVIVCKKKKQD